MTTPLNFTIFHESGTFTGSQFKITVNVSGTVYEVFVHPAFNDTKVLFTLNLVPGTYDISLSFPAEGNVTVPFSGYLEIKRPSGAAARPFLQYNATTGQIFLSPPVGFVLVCLHGNSVIMTPNGNKFIKDAETGDKVITANGEYAKILNVCHCWIEFPGPSHDAVIFEPHSLGDGLPSTRLIIDPGHPIKINKHDEFRPAGEFVNDDRIYVRKWTDEIIQNPTPSIRWDLVLEDGFDNYIANGVIVKSRTSPVDPGYTHRFMQWT